MVLLLLIAAAVAIINAQRERELRGSAPLLRNLLSRFREAEYVRTVRMTSPGARRGRALCVEPDPRRFEQGSGLLTFPDGEPPYAWLVGRRAGFTLDVLERVDRTLTLRLSCGEPTETRRGLRVLFNGKDLLATELRPDSELQSVTVFVPAEDQRRGPNKVELIFDSVVSRQLLDRPTPLPLAAILTVVSFLAEGEEAKPEPPPRRYGLVPTGEANQANLLIPAGTCARLAQSLPDEDRLVLFLGMEAVRAPLLITLQDDFGRRHSLQALDPGGAAPPQLSLDLTPWAGQNAVLEFWAQGDAGEVAIQTMQLRGGDETPTSLPRTKLAEHDERSSFLIVVLDALARSRVGAYRDGGPSLTPNLDALAARGLRVDRAQAPASYTLASTASLLTGQAPLSHGVVQLRNSRGYQRLAGDTPRLALSLADAGWRTAALVTNPNAGARHGYGEGFEEYRELDQDPELWDDGVDGKQLAPRFAELLASYGDEPAFNYVHVFEPHAPYDAPAELRAVHVEPYDGPVRGDRAWLDAFKHGEASADEAGWRHLRQLYAARVAQADIVLGELLGALEASGRAGNTVVLVTSDHGEAFGEHDWVEHGDLTYAEEIDIPLVIAGPGVDRGHVPGPASLIDVAPTLLSLAGVSQPEAMDGIDLLAPTPVDRALTARSAALLPVLSLTRWPWRLHVDTSTRRIALHDLDRDPGETSNLASRRPATTLLLLQELARRVFDARQRPGAAEVAEVDPEQARILAGLGYVGEESVDGEEPLERLSLVLRSLLNRL